MSDVVAGGPGLVAVGGEEPDIYSAMGGIRAAVWTSADGFTWSRVPYDVEIFGGEAGDERSMSAVTSVGSELVAVGGLFVWSSVDGVTWTHFPLDASLSSVPQFGTPGSWEMNSVAATREGPIAVGQEDESAAVWIASQS